MAPQTLVTVLVGLGMATPLGRSPEAFAEFVGTGRLSPQIDSEHAFDRGGHVFAVAL